MNVHLIGSIGPGRVWSWSWVLPPASCIQPWHLFISPSWRGILLCCSPEGFITFFPVKGFFLIWSEVKGQGWWMCTDCKALWGEFVIWDFGLYKINWIELIKICEACIYFNFTVTGKGYLSSCYLNIYEENSYFDAQVLVNFNISNQI